MEDHALPPPSQPANRGTRKGLYAKARAGLIPEFTDVSDLYEMPEKPELAIELASASTRPYSRSCADWSTRATCAEG